MWFDKDRLIDGVARQFGVRGLPKWKKKGKAVRFVKVVKFRGTALERDNLGFTAGQGYK